MAFPTFGKPKGFRFHAGIVGNVLGTREVNQIEGFLHVEKITMSEFR